MRNKNQRYFILTNNYMYSKTHSKENRNKNLLIHPFSKHQHPPNYIKPAKPGSQSSHSKVFVDPVSSLGAPPIVAKEARLDDKLLEMVGERGKTGEVGGEEGAEEGREEEREELSKAVVEWVENWWGNI